MSTPSPALHHKWGKTTRYVKRELSQLEKSNLINTEGRALILPGEPGTEVEELIQAGFDPSKIVGVEKDPAIAEHLHGYYLDGAMIFCDEVCNFMRRAKMVEQYSYIHLDFCGQMNRDLIVALQGWKRLVMPHARVRVSAFRGRRGLLQFKVEQELVTNTLVAWCDAAFAVDKASPERWLHYREWLLNNGTDTAQVIAGVMIANFFFGLDNFEDFIEVMERQGTFLPEVKGRHRLTNITRWNYRERSAANHMVTIWTDLAPLGRKALPSSEQWVVNTLADMITQLVDFVTPDFTWVPR